MPQPEARPEIVALLCDANFKLFLETGTWSHRDGRPFTEEERSLVFRATRADLEELKAQHSRYLEYVQAYEEAPEAIQRFLAPFMEQLDEKNLGNAHALMTEDERTEFDRLLGLMIEPARPFTPYAF
ncbi:hypothetical protein GCM10010230_34350 [Streptomyces narbonensis]|uniref:hypothetical protein n=1 Tax=Streptomyces narbonensis TaxID=67333 RepID=UPI001675FAB0|nr:hypothetical protein [Streptomyces narbonensis]GGW02092.1 hypothetical protein GCM10010230_34350 [Streptomyces narbonensis]